MLARSKNKISKITKYHNKGTKSETFVADRFFKILGAQHSSEFFLKTQCLGCLHFGRGVVARGMCDSSGKDTNTTNFFSMPTAVVYECGMLWLLQTTCTMHT